MNLEDIKGKLQQIDEFRDLNKTPEGKILLENITSNYLSRLIDFTAIESKELPIEDFTSKFSDLVRPNKFSVRFNVENTFFPYDLTIDPFVKAITVPTITTNEMNFKRAGKTINIPLNQDVPDILDLTFYQDIDNKVLSGIFSVMNFNESGYHPMFNSQSTASLSFLYNINMNYNSDIGFNPIQAGLDFFGIDILGKYYNNGDEKFIKNNLTKTIKDKILEIKFNNVYVKDFSGFDFDTERIDTFAELKLQLRFNGVSVYLWDLPTIEGTGQGNGNIANYNNTLGSSENL